MGILEQIAEERAKEVAKKVRKEVTEDVTEKVTQKVTQNVTQKITEKKDHAFVESLLRNTSFNIAKIACIADVSEEFVQKVKATTHKK